MSRIDKSPEQLDAEAAAPLEERDLDAAIHPCSFCGNPYLEGYPHDHHTDPPSGYDPMPDKPVTREALVAVIARELMAEAEDRLHTWAVPSEAEPIWQEHRFKRSDPHEWARDIGPGELKVTDSGALGAPSFSQAFHRRIGGFHWSEDRERVEEDASPKPWTRNLSGIRRWCSGKHRTWYEHRGGPLCWTLVQLVTFGRYSVSRAAQVCEISPEKADELLFGHPDGDCEHAGRCPDGAFDKWWTWTANDLNGLTMKRVKPRQAA